MTGDQRGGMLSSLVLTWSPGVHVSKLQFLAVVLKLSTRLLPMPLLSSFGFRLYFVSWRFPNASRLFSSVITSMLHICPQIPCFMPEQNTLKSTITLSDNELHRSFYRSSSSPPRISLLTSSLNNYRFRSSQDVGAILTYWILQATVKIEGGC
jgi:hypothetical protein